jgi:gliding motility-associated-like protein
LSNPSAIAAGGTYFVKSTSGTCFDIKPVVVSVISSFDFDISGSCVKGSFTLESKPISNSYDGATATFQWKDELGNSIGSNESTLDVSKALANTSVVEEFPLTYSLEITPVGGCPATKSYVISGVICSIPKGISPDGNSKNDEFDLTGLGVKELHIFNRYGTEVYNYTNYTNQWHGQTNGGEELPDGTYFYSIHKVDGSSTTGWVYINRKQ